MFCISEQKWLWRDCTGLSNPTLLHNVTSTNYKVKIYWGKKVVSWSTSELKMRLAPWDRLKPSSKIFYWPFQGGTSFVDLLCLYCLVFVCFVVCFAALRPKSTAIVMAGRSVHYLKEKQFWQHNAHFSYLHNSINVLNSVQQTARMIKIVYAYDNCYIRYLLSSILLLITLP